MVQLRSAFKRLLCQVSALMLLKDPFCSECQLTFFRRTRKLIVVMPQKVRYQRPQPPSTPWALSSLQKNKTVTRVAVQEFHVCVM
jgi:hypothetical protein